MIACLEENLPGATSVTAWSIDRACGVVKEAGKRLKKLEMRAKSNESQKLCIPQEHTNRLVDRVRTEGQLQSSPMTSPIRPSSVRLPTRGNGPQTPMITRSAKATPGKDLEDMVPLSEKLEVKLQLNTAKVELGRTTEKLEGLELVFSKNGVFGIQTEPARGKEISERLSENVTLPEMAPFLHHRASLTFADDLIGFQYKSATTDAIKYLQAIYNDAVGSGNKDKPLEVARRRADVHIPRLGTMMKQFAISASAWDSRLLTAYLEKIIKHLCPKGLSRSCLLVIADKTHRTKTSAPEIWLKAYGQLMALNYDNPYKEWGLLDRLLDRLAFCWFMSRKGDMSISSLQLSDDQMAVIEDLILAFRDRQPQDFIALLQLSAVREFVLSVLKQNVQSALVFLKNSPSEQMAIMRTGPTSSTFPAREYVWMRVGGRSLFQPQDF